MAHRNGTPGPDSVDLWVAGRIRERRLVLEMRQTDLAASLAVPLSRIKAYERGTCRIDAARLLRVATALGVSVDYFFEGLDDPNGPDVAGSLPDKCSREAFSLVRAFNAIPDAQVRKRVLTLAKTMAGSRRRP